MKSQNMYIIVFGIFIIKVQISISVPRFPPHIDLQKVGEAIFNNEKFNILKPTTHRVTDHFKDFMLRTESSYHPAKRVFIDNNGFRHDWFGFGEKTKSLRKTDLKHVSGSLENASENTPESNINSTDGNDNTTAPVEDTNISDNNVSSNENENNNQEVENKASDNNDTIKKFTEEDTETPESKEMSTINLFPAIRTNNSSTKIVIEERLRQGKDDAKAKPAPAKKADTEKKDKPKKEKKETKKTDDSKKSGPASKEDGKKKDKKTDSGDKAKTEDKTKDGKAKEKKSNDKKERTVATTTFFCPYFGTITMSSFID